MRKIVVYFATSADGFIARPDGSVDWLHRPGTAGDYGMAAFRRSIDSIVLGRKTYEFGLQHGARFNTQPKHYVFTRNATGLVKATGVEFVSEEPVAFAKHLRAQPGKNIWMMGGAALIGAFVDQNQIDEFIIHVVPTFIGEVINPLDRNLETTSNEVVFFINCAGVGSKITTKVALLFGDVQVLYRPVP